MSTTFCFSSFGRYHTGRVITHTSTSIVIWARNPYGSHNLVLVDNITDEAWRHGNEACLFELMLLERRAYRRTRKFLAQRGQCLDITIFERGKQPLLPPPPAEIILDFDPLPGGWVAVPE